MDTVHSYLLTWWDGKEKREYEMYCSERDDDRITRKFRDDTPPDEMIEDLTVEYQGEGPGNLDLRNALRYRVFWLKSQLTQSWKKRFGQRPDIRRNPSLTRLETISLLWSHIALNIDKELLKRPRQNTRISVLHTVDPSSALVWSNVTPLGDVREAVPH